MSEQYGFGSGELWAVPKIDLAGDAVTYPTPVPFGALQEISVDISFSKKELFGQKAFPLAVARSTAKPTIKAKAARINSAAFNLLFGETPSTGEVKAIFEEAGTVPASSAYTITVDNSSTFVTDLGVKYADGSGELTRVASGSEVEGSYSVSAGVYTFDEDDASTAVKISYTYTTSSAPGQVVVVDNPLIGLAPFFELHLREEFQGNELYVKFYRVMSEKLSFGTKQEDFVIPEFDMSAMADDSGYVFQYSFTQG